MNYFDWAIFNRFLYVYQMNNLKLELRCPKPYPLVNL